MTYGRDIVFYTGGNFYLGVVVMGKPGKAINQLNQVFF
jgi:hypothetical protein